MNLIENIRAFVRVAHCRSFSLAAEQLGMTQSTASKQIASLERHLAVKLLNRSTRRVKLTAEGVTYLVFAQRILDTLEEAECQVGRSKGKPAGLVRVGSPYSFAQRFLVGKVALLLKRYPLVKIEMAGSDMSPSLVENDIDVAIRFGEPTGDLFLRRIGTTARIAVASPSYLARHGTPNEPQDLVHHECLQYKHPALSPDWTFDLGDQSTSVKTMGRFSSNSAQVIKDACLAGLGVAVMPDWLFGEHLKSGKLKRILEKYEPQSLPLSIVYASGKYAPLKTRAVVEFLYVELRRELAAVTRA